MDLKLYQVDAFANHLFEGNPAAVCPLQDWLSDEQMQAIAAENNISETAFFIADGSGYHIRWFTPTNEIELCGHATLASAYIIFNELGSTARELCFQSLSGPLIVTRDDDWLVLDFPAQAASSCPTPAPIIEAFKVPITECLAAEDYIVVFKNEADILEAKPDMSLLKQLGLRGVIITAASTDYDFVSRFFAPNFGIDEDPVTGSSFTQLAPYWSRVFGKSKLTAKQQSQRGGEVHCEHLTERVKIYGKAVKYMDATIHI